MKGEGEGVGEGECERGIKRCPHFDKSGDYDVHGGQLLSLLVDDVPSLIVDKL